MNHNFVIACETVVEVSGKNELMYAVFMDSPIFPDFESASAAIRSEKLPLGWVAIEAHRLIPIPQATGCSPQEPK